MHHKEFNANLKNQFTKIAIKARLWKHSTSGAHAQHSMSDVLGLLLPILETSFKKEEPTHERSNLFHHLVLEVLLSRDRQARNCEFIVTRPLAANTGANQ